MNNPGLSAIDTSVTPNETIDGKLLTKSAWAISGATGYDFGGVRVGLDLSYQRSKIKGLQLLAINGATPTDEDIDDALEDGITDGLTIDGTTIRATSGSFARLRQLAVMAHVTYDVPIGNDTIRPYVGVGAGLVASYLQAPLLDVDDGSVRFAWQVRAGAAVKVTRGVDITADYTYRQASSGKLQFDDEEDGEYRLGKTKASLFQIGLHFTL